MLRVPSLTMVKCTRCGRIDAATRTICSECLGDSFECVEVEGAGNLVSWTTIHRAPTRFRDEAPYQVGVVDLDSGQRVTGRLQPSAHTTVGARVIAVDVTGPAPVFQLAQT